MTTVEPPPTTPSASAALALLDAVVTERDGTSRPGQQLACAAIADALHTGRHLVVEAPTGVGKTFAAAAGAVTWLVAQRRSGGDSDEAAPRVVIATATLALQEQLVGEDLPLVVEVARAQGHDVSVAVLKGRGNYLCLARADDQEGSLFEGDRNDAARLARAASRRGDGQRSSLPPVDDDAWRRLSCSGEECPGAAKCSRGDDCWSELARRQAHHADVLVVNLALYAAHLLAGEGVLPAHQAVIVDEAHALADTMVSAASVSMSPARLRSLARSSSSLVSAATTSALTGAADGLTDALEGTEGSLDPTEGDVAVHLAAARAAARDIARIAADTDTDAASQVAAQAANLAEDLMVLGQPHDDDRVAWRDRDGPLRSAPVEPADLLGSLLWDERTVIAMSATLRNADQRGAPTFDGFLSMTGAPHGRVTTLAVPSPFDFRTQAMLYVPRGHIPSPREAGWSEGVAAELWRLAVAADGRTLALFTSRAATERVAEDLRSRVEEAGNGLEILTQWDGPRDLLVGALRRRRRVVLCATRSFWTGIDIPGDACVVVAIDRIPFPRPDDPLVSARRDRATAAGKRAFEAIDLPMAAAQLAQGTGRLIRSDTDRGVVAVLDTRLATASWRQRVLGALPPLRRSVDPDEVVAFLAEA